jgi:hypothetical protein
MRHVYVRQFLADNSTPEIRAALSIRGVSPRFLAMRLAWDVQRTRDTARVVEAGEFQTE